MSGTRFDEGLELARLLVATGPFNPREVSARQWELLSQAFEALFPYSEIGCSNGGCPGKVSLAYQKVTYKLREADPQNPAPLAQQSAASLAAETSPTTQPTSAAEAAPATMATKETRLFHFQPGKHYREMGSNTTYTNDNITDKAARRILKNDPAARRLFVPFENSALSGEAEKSVASSSIVTGNYGQSIDQSSRPADAPQVAVSPRIAAAVAQVIAASAQQVAAAAAPTEPTNSPAPAGDLGNDDEHDETDEHENGDDLGSDDEHDETDETDEDLDDDEHENDLSAADAENPMTAVFGAMKRTELNSLYLQQNPGSNPAVFQNKGEIIKALVAAQSAA